MEKKNIGERLQRYRKEANLKQADVARKLGVTQTAVSNWEINLSRPTLEMLMQMASLYSVSLDTLCGMPEKKDGYRISTFIRDLSTACYHGVLQIGKDQNGRITFTMPKDLFLYADEKWEDGEPSPGFIVHGTAEFFDTLQNLIAMRDKGLKNTDAVIGSWVGDTIKRARDEADSNGFESAWDSYRSLNGIEG